MFDYTFEIDTEEEEVLDGLSEYHTRLAQQQRHKEIVRIEGTDADLVFQEQLQSRDPGQFSTRAMKYLFRSGISIQPPHLGRKHHEQDRPDYSSKTTTTVSQKNERTTTNHHVKVLMKRVTCSILPVLEPDAILAHEEKQEDRPPTRFPLIRRSVMSHLPEQHTSIMEVDDCTPPTEETQPPSCIMCQYQVAGHSCDAMMMGEEKKTDREDIQNQNIYNHDTKDQQQQQQQQQPFRGSSTWF